MNTEIYSQNGSVEIIVLFLVTANQRRGQWTFTSEKTSFMASDWTKDVFSPVNGDRTGNHLTFGMKTGKLPLHFQDVEKV